MDRFETNSILNHARDSSSSLLWLRDAESARTVTSLATENLETVDMTFDFDELIVTSKVYRTALASFLKQKIRGDKKSARHIATGTTPNLSTQGEYSQAKIVLVNPAQIPSKGASPSGQWPAPLRIADSYLANWLLDASSASNSNESSVPGVSINARSPSDIPTSSNGDTGPRNEVKTDLHQAILDQNVLLKPLTLPSQHSLAFNLERWPFETSTLGEVQPESIDSRAQRSIGEEENGQNQDDPTSGREIEQRGDNDSPTFSASPSISDGEIDFDFVHSLHTFASCVEGQADVTKGDTLLLLDDSNAYWWLVRVIKDSSIGYIPAEHVETPTERLARLNKHRNIDVTGTLPGDKPTKPPNSKVTVLQKNKQVKAVRFNNLLAFINRYPEAKETTV